LEEVRERAPELQRALDRARSDVERWREEAAVHAASAASAANDAERVSDFWLASAGAADATDSAKRVAPDLRERPRVRRQPTVPRNEAPAARRAFPFAEGPPPAGWNRGRSTSLERT
jgi:hypothetical protein